MRHITRIAPCAVAVAALLTCAASAPAHDWYIQSVDYLLPGPGATVLFQGWGHKLPLDDAIAGEKIASLRLIAPDGSATTLTVAPERGFHVTPVELSAPGIYTVAGESNPGYYNIYADIDGKVRHSTDALDELKDAARVMMSVRAYQFPKTYLAVGDTDDASTPQPVGAKLEIVPVQAPGTLHAGDRLELSILFEGRPVPDGTEFDATYMGFSTEMEDYLYTGRTTTGGRGHIDLACAGVWYIRTHFTQPAGGEWQGKCRELMYNATLALSVAPRSAAGAGREHSH